jgi:hypothetical protein
VSRDTRLVGLDAALAFFAAVPTAAQQEMVVELGIIGRELLDAQHHDVARDTGALDAALSLQVLGDGLKVRIGLLRGARAAGTSNGRKVKARAGGPFYGGIVEDGRRAQTVLVTRRVKKRRVNGNGRTSKRTVTYLGATKRKRPASSPNAGTFVGDPYKLRVKARAAHPFVAQPVLMGAAELHFADFWADALTRLGG